MSLIRWWGILESFQICLKCVTFFYLNSGDGGGGGNSGCAWDSSVLSGVSPQWSDLSETAVATVRKNSGLESFCQK